MKEVPARMIDVSMELHELHRCFSSAKALSRTEKYVLISLQQKIIPHRGNF